MPHKYLVSIFCFFSKICNCPSGPITHCDFILNSCYIAVLYNFGLVVYQDAIPNSVMFLTLTCSAKYTDENIFFFFEWTLLVRLFCRKPLSLSLSIILPIITYFLAAVSCLLLHHYGNTEFSQP